MILSSTGAVLNTVFQFLLEHQKTVVADPLDLSLGRRLGLHC
jgi:hypothetical protein